MTRRSGSEVRPGLAADAPTPSPTARPTRLVDQPTWCAVAWIMIGSLAVWSYGVNNIALPWIPVPLVDLVLVALLVRSRAWWRPLTRSGVGAVLLVCIVTLSADVSRPVAVGLSEHGIQAARGALFAFEIWAVFVGLAVARRVGRPTVIRMIGAVFAIALVWFALFPFRSWIGQFSPVVGIQRPAPLFAYNTMGVVASWALFWFGSRRDRPAAIATVAAVAAFLFAQSRGAIAGVLVALVLYTLASRGRGSGRVARRMVGAGAALLVVLTVLPPLPGRLGTVSADVLLDAVRTGIGREGDVASSYDSRLEWNRATFDAIANQRLGWLGGVGFGVDLTGGFGTASGAIINPHNDFLEFYARLGAFVLPWYLAWLATLREFWSRARRGDRLAAWGVAAWVIMVFASATQPFNSFAYGGMLWWLTAGLVLGATTPLAPGSRSLDLTRAESRESPCR